MLCAQCSSDNVRKLSLVYEHGLTHVSRTGAHITEAGAKASPPRKRGLGGPLLLAIATGFFGFAWGGLWIVTVIALVLLIANTGWNAQRWPALYRAWDSAYMCERCGFIGAPAPAAPRVPTVEPAAPLAPTRQTALGPEPLALEAEAGAQKLCPHCRSYIPAGASVCRYCRRDLDPPAALSS